MKMEKNKIDLKAFGNYIRMLDEESRKVSVMKDRYDSLKSDLEKAKEHLNSGLNYIDEVLSVFHPKVPITKDKPSTYGKNREFIKEALKDLYNKMASGATFTNQMLSLMYQHKLSKSEVAYLGLKLRRLPRVVIHKNGREIKYFIQ